MMHIARNPDFPSTRLLGKKYQIPQTCSNCTASACARKYLLAIYIPKKVEFG